VTHDLLLPVRTATGLEAMREAGRVVARALQAVSAAAVPGVRLRELDDIVATCIREAGMTPSFLGYAPAGAPTPFNGVTCLSPNDVVVHRRPSSRRLWEGDLLTVDCGAVADGWNGDAALTVHVGDPTPQDTRLRQATEDALAAGIAAAQPGATLLDVAVAIDAVARRRLRPAARPRRARHRPQHARTAVRAQPTDPGGPAAPAAAREHDRDRANAARRHQPLPHQERRLVHRHRRRPCGPHHRIAATPTTPGATPHPDPRGAGDHEVPPQPVPSEPAKPLREHPARYPCRDRYGSRPTRRPPRAGERGLGRRRGR